MTELAKRQNHRWSKPNPFAQKTERECLRCHIIRVTMHPEGRSGRRHWKEFWRDGEKIEGKRTPVCEPVPTKTEEVA